MGMPKPEGGVLEGFSARVGVSEENVRAVLLGLAEDERRDRHGAVTMCGLLMRCQDECALHNGEVVKSMLCREIDAAIDAYAVRLGL